jgi:UDP:flavonoid glycosyltransferase YjiC (YdhE family)
LRAGIPALVIPHFADQFYWGGMVKNLGVGPAPISRSKLNVDSLVRGLRDLMGDELYRLVSYELGKQIRNEDGVLEAVRLIENEFALGDGEK